MSDPLEREDGADIVVCLPLTEKPSVASVVEVCEKCHKPVWFTIDNKLQLEKENHLVVFWCSPCALAAMPPDAKFGEITGQREWFSDRGIDLDYLHKKLRRLAAIFKERLN